METRSNVKTLEQNEIDHFLSSNIVGVLSMTDGNSTYAIPLAYSYEKGRIYLTINFSGRKSEYIKNNRNVCFVVYWIPEGFGSPDKMTWKSVVCEGRIEHLTDADTITRAVRTAEKQMKMPEGAWNNLLEMTLKNSESSNFWCINIEKTGGRGVDNEFVEFIEE